MTGNFDWLAVCLFMSGICCMCVIEACVKQVRRVSGEDIADIRAAWALILFRHPDLDRERTLMSVHAPNSYRVSGYLFLSTALLLCANLLF